MTKKGSGTEQKRNHIWVHRPNKAIIQAPSMHDARSPDDDEDVSKSCSVPPRPRVLSSIFRSPASHMPAETRSKALTSVFASDTFRPQHPDNGPTRKVASKNQLLILHAFRNRVASKASKDELEEVSRQTGLDVKWIRKWLSRQKHPRVKNRLNIDSESGFESPGSSSGTAISHSTAFSVCMSSFQCEITPMATASSELDGINTSWMTSSSGSLPRPDVGSRSYSAPNLSVATSSFLSGPSYANDTTDARSELSGSDSISDYAARPLTMSPSLGYIPSLFPPPAALVPVSQTVPTSLTSTPTFSSQAQNQMQSQVQTTCPALEPEYPELDDSMNATNMAALIKLLSTVSSSQPQMQSQLLPSLQGNGNTTCTTHLTAASVTIPSSSFASLASLRSQHAFAPQPVAYKMHYTDLVALTKRVRATQWSPVINNSSIDSSGADVTNNGDSSSDSSIENIATPPRNSSETDRDVGIQDPDADCEESPSTRRGVDYLRSQTKLNLRSQTKKILAVPL
ncbi:hypothetical protein EIP86_006545 [Pleurotus ostreatoroseus]|nr:hypothetical protein EIP86_006545 [Pleurotus ostreatoroseus]